MLIRIDIKQEKQHFPDIDIKKENIIELARKTPDSIAVRGI